MNDRICQANDQVHWKTVENEAVLVHFESGTYFALDELGTFLWRRIAADDEGVRQSRLIADTLAEFDAEAGAVQTDVHTFCAQLEAEDLIRFVN